MPTTRHLVLLGAGLVGASVATTSAISLYSIAVRCGIPEPWAAANPIALDAGAAVAALAWITEQGERRTWARGTAVTALAASLAENGVDHAVGAGFMPVTIWLVLAVSACIPATLFAVVHLAALMARPVSDESDKPAREAHTETPAGTEVPSTVPAGLPDEPPQPPRPRLVRDVVSAANSRPAEVRAQVEDTDPVEEKARELVAAGGGRGTLVKELGLNPTAARMLAKQLKAQP